MDDELINNNILGNSTPKQKHGINISKISKDKLEDILKDNNDSEDGSIYNNDDDIDEDEIKGKSKTKDDKGKDEKSKGKDGKNKEKDEKKKLKEEAKEEEKRKKEEEKKRKDEEKRKKDEEKEEKKKHKEEEKEEKKKQKEEEKKLKDEEKKKEKEEKKKEKEEKKLKDKTKLKPLKDSEGDEEVTGSNGFLHKFLHKNTSRDKLSSLDNLSSDKEESEAKLGRSKSRSQTLFSGSNKKLSDEDNKGCVITEAGSNVNSIINLLENNKFGNSNNNLNHHNGSVGNSHDSLASDENLCKNKVKKNIKLFSHKKFNTTIESNDFPSSKKDNQSIKLSASLDQVQKDKSVESFSNMVNDQSTSSNNGLLVSKKVTAPPKRRPPTKKKILEDAETAYTQRTGNEYSKGFHSTDVSFKDFKNDDLSFKLLSFNSLKDSYKFNLTETSNKEIDKMGDDEIFDDDMEKNSFEDNVIDIKKKLTKKLINKQKFSDKLYPGGENCDSNIVESKSIFCISECGSPASTSETNLTEKEETRSPSRENIKLKKNTSFNNGPVPPFRKDRSTTMNGGVKTPKSTSTGNISTTSSNQNTPVTPKKMGSLDEHTSLLVSHRVSARPKRRPPSHIGISSNSRETTYTLKEDVSDNLLCPSNQESYMSNIKISEVKIAKKIDQKQINLLKLPSKEPAIKLETMEEVEDSKKENSDEDLKEKSKSEEQSKSEEKPKPEENLNNDVNNIKKITLPSSSSNNSISNDDSNKASNKSYIPNNRMSVMNPSFMSELGGHLSKRSSMATNVSIEEKMKVMSKKKQEDQDDNKNVFEFKLKSKDSSSKNNDKPISKELSPASELANNSFFKKRATLVNSENNDSNEETPNVLKLKTAKKVDNVKPEENDDETDGNEKLSVMEKISLLQKKNAAESQNSPSKFQKNKLFSNTPGDSPVKSSPNTPNKSRFLS